MWTQGIYPKTALCTSILTKSEKGMNIGAAGWASVEGYIAMTDVALTVSAGLGLWGVVDVLWGASEYILSLLGPKTPFTNGIPSRDPTQVWRT
ncbi:hypothetical protein A2943_03105 [Candidatus Adlerbacteria bacterium RIFCSPLOWO2_01_FULL_51_16]|uniref:Uncharacterized protein n=1 Tax=Candidatus Adlerbacteria bacterium RIFCSPLOWO2_01_FULL_51_16 TaxID=1797243 RepID=A0A1F4XH00_9BACT|nr:MAG: hypothetical protein A2943_03105 [Candidatus Adlerbacteria bacterium RIFCSPLOWO2_01_FULL_51_16]